MDNMDARSRALMEGELRRIEDLEMREGMRGHFEDTYPIVDRYFRALELEKALRADRRRSG